MKNLFTISKLQKACNQIDAIATQGVGIYFVSSNGFDISQIFKSKQDAKLALESNLDSQFVELNIWSTQK